VNEAFDLFDADKDGRLDYHQLKVAMRALGFEVKKAEVQRMLREYDPDTSEPHRHIDLRCFTEAVTSRILERNPKDEVFKAFKLFDNDGSGQISFENLRSVITVQTPAISLTLDKDLLGQISFQKLAVHRSDIFLTQFVLHGEVYVR
jgi:Ca2+-binding EF-hand superfamily protein